MIDESTWNSVANFKPWPEYDSGLDTLSEFLQTGAPSFVMKEIQTDEVKYFWIELDNLKSD
jgi:hypothetical protein